MLPASLSLFRQWMLKHLSICLLFFVLMPSLKGQHPFSSENDSLFNEYLKVWRTHPAILRTFFKEMPKGGELHHHFGGAFFPEFHIRTMIKENLYINPYTLAVKQKLRYDDGGFERVATLMKKKPFPPLYDKLLRQWSNKDFKASSTENNADFFFNTFQKFATPLSLSTIEGLLTIKKQALEEHISYLETMFQSVPLPSLDSSRMRLFSQELRKLFKEKNTDQIAKVFDEMWHYFTEKQVPEYAIQYAEKLDRQHEQLFLDDNFFSLRYQNYAVRTQEPAYVFADLASAFIAANKSKYTVGVNIVGPEHHIEALQDYSLHMAMFAYLAEKYPNVSRHLHAGELTLNLVAPSDLNNHIDQAIHTAKAQRIGHGVSISYEKNPRSLLEEMAQQKIPVEINLTSNEFILGVSKENHPITLYYAFGVPLVLSTDDAGILRTTQTDQFVLLAQRYPDFSYADIKTFVANSIQYAAIADDLKNKLMERLKRDFQIFEMKWLQSPIVPAFKPTINTINDTLPAQNETPNSLNNEIF